MQVYDSGSEAICSDTAILSQMMPEINYTQQERFYFQGFFFPSLSLSVCTTQRSVVLSTILPIEAFCCHSIQFSNQDSANTCQKYPPIVRCCSATIRRRRDGRMMRHSNLSPHWPSKAWKELLPRTILYIYYYYKHYYYISTTSEKISLQPALWRH